MYINFSKHIQNINSASLSQNFLRTDQLKHMHLECTRNYIRDGTKEVGRPYPDSGYTDHDEFSRHVMRSNKNKIK